jgi:hypothetical protein
MPSRRQVLATLQCGLSAAVVGCQSPVGDATTDAVTDTPSEGEPTATSSDQPTVEVHFERASHWLQAVEVGLDAELRTRDVVALPNLDAPTRDAVETAIADGTYETNEPSTALLDGIDDETYLAESGIDPDEVEAAATEETTSKSRDEIVREAVRELSEPTEAAVVEYAEEHGVSPSFTKKALRKLVQAGEASESRGTYRLL